MRQLSSRLMAACLLAFAACEAAPGEVGSVYVKSVYVRAAEGAVIEIAQSESRELAGTRLVIEPGALMADTTITVGLSNTNLVSLPSEAASPVVVLGPTSTVLTAAAKLRIPIALPVGREEQDLFVGALDHPGALIEHEGIEVSGDRAFAQFATSSLNALQIGAYPACTAGLTRCQASCRDTRGDPRNCGNCGSSCATGETCRSGTCQSANLVFVSSEEFVPGMLGGLAGADAACQRLAEGAGLTGHFVAWLSSSSSSARDRLLRPGTNEAPRGWTRMDGLPFADTVAALLDDTQAFYPVLLDELGREVPEYPWVVTGTSSTGQVLAGQTCNDWASTEGECRTASALAVGPKWTEHGKAISCADSARLYCFQTEFSQAVAPPPIPPGGRIAFLSSAWTPSGGGQSALDAHCQSDASAAGLTGRTFRALVATTTSPMADPNRFDFTGPAWFRPDGVLIMEDPWLLREGAPRLLGPIAQQADGSYPLLAAWTGVETDLWGGTHTLGKVESTCGDWHLSGEGARSALGRPTHVTRWFSDHYSPCITSVPAAGVYCLEI